MSEKIIGYVLLAVGVLIVLGSALSVYQVFTKQAQPIQLFNLPGISLDLSSSLSATLPPELAKNVKEQSKPTEIIPAETVNQTSNILAHILLMGFLAGIGQKIASLGIELLRPVVVKLREGKL